MNTESVLAFIVVISIFSILIILGRRRGERINKLTSDRPEEARTAALSVYKRFIPETVLTVIGILIFLYESKIIGLILFGVVAFLLINHKKILRNTKNADYTSSQSVAIRKSGLAFLAMNYLLGIFYTSNTFIHTYWLLLLIIILCASVGYYFYLLKHTK